MYINLLVKVTLSQTIHLNSMIISQYCNPFPEFLWLCLRCQERTLTRGVSRKSGLPGRVSGRLDFGHCVLLCMFWLCCLSVKCVSICELRTVSMWSSIFFIFYGCVQLRAMVSAVAESFIIVDRITFLLEQVIGCTCVLFFATVIYLSHRLRRSESPELHRCYREII